MAEIKPKRIRKGPTESATLFAVGTRKRGNDGGMWVIRATSKGIHRWQPAQTATAKAKRSETRANTVISRPSTTRRAGTGRTKRSEARRPGAGRAPLVGRRESAKKEPRTAPVEKATQARSRYHILFCEPYSVDDAKQLKKNLKKKNAAWFTGVKFDVDPAFYAVLLRKPKSIKRANGNAYIFGRRFPLSQYTFVGDHGNDGAQTGFIDLDLFANGDKVLDVVLEAFGPKRRRGPEIVWDDRAALRRIRAQLPHILFLGETVGGDVGASLYAHRTHGKIDGLIIDNNLLFKEKEE